MWFLSIDVGSPVVAAALRTMIGAPYHPGPSRVDRRGDTVQNNGVRGADGPSYHLSIRTGPELRPSTLETWLAGRWRAWTRHLGRLVVTPVAHEPWPLPHATVEHLEQDLDEAAGTCPGRPSAGRAGVLTLA